MKHQVAQCPNTQHTECPLSITSLTCDKYMHSAKTVPVERCCYSLNSAMILFENKMLDLLIRPTGTSNTTRRKLSSKDIHISQSSNLRGNTVFIR